MWTIALGCKPLLINYFPEEIRILGPFYEHPLNLDYQCLYLLDTLLL